MTAKTVREIIRHLMFDVTREEEKVEIEKAMEQIRAAMPSVSELMEVAVNVPRDPTDRTNDLLKNVATAIRELMISKLQ